MLNEKKISVRFSRFFSNGLSYANMKFWGRIPLFRTLARLLRYKRQTISSRDVYWNIQRPSRLINLLRENGYSTALKLNADIVSKLQDYADANPVHAYMDKDHSFFHHDRIEYENKLGKKILIAHYPNLHKSDLFSSIAKSDVIQSIAEAYCGLGVKCIAKQMWWTFPVDVDVQTRSRFAHFYHRDVDGFNFLKFFVYLSDVKTGEGGHFFVTGSHKPSFGDMVSERFRVGRISDRIITSRYGENRICEFTGKAGKVIIEDTFGLHKGQTPNETPRLIACFVFGMKDYKVQNFII